MAHGTRGSLMNHQSEDSESETSDEDYSPGSLVIDTKEGSVSPQSPVSTPRETRQKHFFHNDFREESPDIPPIVIPTLSPPTPTPPPPHTLTPSQPSSTHSGYNTPTPMTAGTPVAMETRDEAFHGVSFVLKKDVTRNVDRPPLDTLCFYQFHWGGASVDVITRNEDSTLIPVKNIYEKVIPGLKRNVLSARNSKLGVKSIVLPEPYVSALKATDLGVTGSSHYMTIPNFTRICKYFKHSPPEILAKFDSITSRDNPDGILATFNSSVSGKGFDLTGGANFGGHSSIISEAGPPNLGAGSATPPNRGQEVRLRRNRASDTSEGESRKTKRTPAVPKRSPYRAYNSPSHNEGVQVDARRLILQGGMAIILLIKGGEAFIPNPELTKLLPVVSRTAMDQIRTQCGVTVTLASKGEIAILKYADVIRDKAGRVLLYKMSDVVKIYAHWHQPLPAFIREICDGKFPEERLDPDATSYTPAISNSSLLPDWSTSASPQGGVVGHHVMQSSQTPPTFNPNVVVHHTATGQPHGYGFSLPGGGPVAMTTGAGAAMATGEGISSLPTSFSPILEGGLTPERFQQPVNMLNSFQQGYLGFTAASQGHVIPPSAHVSSVARESPLQSNLVAAATAPPPSAPNLTAPQATRGERKRSLSISGPPLNDQEVEYTQLPWGDQTLTMLRPSDSQPHLALPELVDKVFHHRSLVSVQRRAQLGVVSVPATSIQIHALRARGSLDTFTGNTKLISLSGAVRLAVEAALQIPGNVIQELKKHCQEPLESILHPSVVPPSSSSSSSSSSHPHPSHPPPSTSTSGSTLTHFTIKPQRSRKTKAKDSAPISTGGEEEGGVATSELPDVPSHPDIIDLRPKYVTAEGVMCQVRWNADKLVVYLTSKGINYMGLYQCYNLLFKEYVNRMSFKMRMRKLDIRSNRAPPAIRVKLIALNALPFNCPVCGLITVSEMEQLAKSYGITPPQVFYDYLITEPSKQAVVKTKRQESGAKIGDGKQAAFEEQIRRAKDRHVVPFLGQPSSGGGGHVTTQDGTGVIVMSSGARSTSASNWEEFQSKAGMEQSSDALIVSIPRQYTPFKVLSSEDLKAYKSAFSNPLTHFAAAPSSSSSSSSPGQPPMKQLQSQFKTSVLKNLAKKITQKSRKFSSSATPQMPGNTANGKCPSCERINPLSKKRCQFCGEYLIGRRCPSCGALNHNRTRECFKCYRTIPQRMWGAEEGGGGGGEEGEEGTISHQPNGDEEDVGVVSEEMLSPPTSPKFSAPPIRSAALKSMFPQPHTHQVSSKPGSSAPQVAPPTFSSPDDHPSNSSGSSQVVTKTMYSGTIASSRRCQECGQLNSRMAKKCMQCRSPLQGKGCHRCGRPNLNHSTQCYKCGAQIVPTATKWVYVGSHSGRAYKATRDTSIEAKLLESRAPISCIRCHKLRLQGRFKCGRCGDVFTSKPLVDPLRGEGAEGQGEGAYLTPTPAKRRKERQEDSASPEPPDPRELERFARNVLGLGLGEGLVPRLSELEEEARGALHPAEGELEAIDEEYQAFLIKKNLKTAEFDETQAEMHGLLAEVSSHNSALHQLLDRERAAKEEVDSLPGKISQLQARLAASGELLAAEH